MPQSSEATRRVFERALSNLDGKLGDDLLSAIRALVTEGNFGCMDKLEEILAPKEASDAD